MFGTVTLGVLLPFLGTTLGAATVFLLKKELNPKIRKFLLGFAAGVMIAASIWSLILPAADLAVEQGQPEWLPPVVGFVLGMLFLLALDTFVPHQHLTCDKPEGCASSLGKSKLLFMSVTLHNIPEGMAVGAVFAGLLAAGAEISLAAAFSLSVGIALQNFPEGAIISLPLKADGQSNLRSFFFGAASGIVEPIAALVTIAFSAVIMPVLSYLLAFAAGAMIYVVVEELIPESQDGEHSNIATVGVMLGFAIMMVLDMALG